MAVRREAPQSVPQQHVTEEQLDRNARILARAIYRELRKNGFTEQQIIAIVAGLIECVLEETHQSH
ncbi:hypothetical protein HY480_03335 [Candidatus Uhrbacteria bacterium]|nr:hypothetical protein [Candidatus Uhrbacteria bacterium]